MAAMVGHRIKTLENYDRRIIRRRVASRRPTSRRSV